MDGDRTLARAWALLALPSLPTQPTPNPTPTPTPRQPQPQPPQATLAACNVAATLSGHPVWNQPDVLPFVDGPFDQIPKVRLRPKPITRSLDAGLLRLAGRRRGAAACGVVCAHLFTLPLCNQPALAAGRPLDCERQGAWPGHGIGRHMNRALQPGGRACRRSHRTPYREREPPLSLRCRYCLILFPEHCSKPYPIPHCPSVAPSLANCLRL